ncbi:ATP-binding cassette domain-containing protein [Paenibacillus sp. TH7-28]
MNRFNLRIDAGSTIAIVGKSGAGKTSMANLPYNLYNVDNGELLIDGMNVNEYNLHSLRSPVFASRDYLFVLYEKLHYPVVYLFCW